MRKKRWFTLMSFPTREKGIWFRVEFKSGDDWWRPSIWITHRWFGGWRWHILFLPG